MHVLLSLEYIDCPLIKFCTFHRIPDTANEPDSEDEQEETTEAKEIPLEDVSIYFKLA